MILQLHNGSASIALILALCLNAILILLVLKRSPKEMKLYKRILLQTAIVDIILSVLTLLALPAFFVYNGWLMIFSFSSLSDYLALSVQFRLLMINIWLIVCFFSLFGLCVQFVYRFLSLNRGLKINLKTYLGMLSIALIIAFTTWSYSLFFVWHKTLILPNDDEIKLIEQQLNENISNFLVSRRRNDDLSQQIVKGAETFDFALCFCIIAICGYKMARFVDKNLDKNSTRRQQINKQITLNLCIQALLPLSLNIIGILIIAAISFFNFGSLNLQMCIVITSHWLPVLNPLVPIICVSDYRKAVTKFIRCATSRCRKRQNTVVPQQSIAMIASENNNGHLNYRRRPIVAS